MKTFLIVSAALFLGACASDDGKCRPDRGGGATAKSGEGGGERAGGASIWDQLDRARKDKKDKGTVAASNEAAARSLPEGWKEKIDAWWKLYATNDPGWPEARAQWIALSDPAPASLVENLLRAYVVAWDSGQRSEFERAKSELLTIPQHSVPILVIGLASGSGDTVVRNVSTDLLAAAGEQAVPAIERAWAGAKPKGRWELARALRKMNSPAAVPMLARIAKSRSEAFEPRIEALQGLGEMRHPAGWEAVVTGVSDPDRSVRKFAIQALGAYGKKDAVPILTSARQQAQARGENDVAEEATKSLQALGNP
jgi:HEAT repeat protein